MEERKQRWVRAVGGRVGDEALARARTLEAVFSSMQDGVLVVDAEYRIVLANDAAARIFGVSKDELLIPLADYPDKFQLRSEVTDHPLPVAARALLGEAVGPEDRTITRPDGRVRHVRASATPLRHDSGLIEGAVVMIGDITDQRRRERGERLLSKLSLELVETIQIDAALQAVADLVTAEIADFCAIDVLEEGGVRRAAVSERSNQDASRPLGAGADYHSFVHVPMNARGRGVGSLTLALEDAGKSFDELDRDYARQVAHRAALAIDNAHLLGKTQLAMRRREEILAVVSHDLRSPLNAVQMSATLISKQSKSSEGSLERIKKHAETIVRASGRMTRMIEDLLDLESIEEGRLKVELVPVEPPAIAADAADATHPLAAERSLTFSLHVEPNLPRVECDRTRILQVLENLIGNALKVTPPGGTIALEVARRGHEVVFSVADTGPGIADEDLPHLFERYWRGRASQTYRGTGRGLAIAKGIVEAHSGRIWAERRQGSSGAVIRFTLLTAGD